MSDKQPNNKQKSDIESILQKGEGKWVSAAEPVTSLKTDPYDPNTPTLLEQVNKVPKKPGCYLWKDATGQILYVGKAKDLRARMRQYILGQDEREKIPLMMSQVTSFEYLVVTNEYESLVLEKNLIQHYHPPFNVDYRDDKSYPFIAVTKSDTYPAIKFTREKHKTGTRYFGPFTNPRAARDLIDIVRRVIPICSASCAEWKRLKRRLDKNPDDKSIIDMLMQTEGRACFDFSVGKAPGVCVGEISPEEYRENHVKPVERFLSGRRNEVIHEIRDRMERAASDLNFERAARERDKIYTIRKLNEEQTVQFSTPVDLDLIGVYRDNSIAGVHVFVVREGRVIIGNEFVLNAGLDVPLTELVETFIKRYYDGATDVPKEVLVPCDLDDAELLSRWLTNLRGTKVVIRKPLRGEKKHLLDMAHTNAKHTLLRFKVKTRYEDKRVNEAILELESALALPRPPLRIECFDISTIHGSYNVASMVVFENGSLARSQYRRFKIKLKTDVPNDYEMMREVISRRFSPKRMKDAEFGSTPDLVIVDGGKGQLNAARSALDTLGLVDAIPTVSLAEKEEEIFVPWQEYPIILPVGSPSFYLVKRIRDEAHRFAITFHRELRGKGMKRSILDGISGVGEKRKKAIWRQFKTVDNLLDASVNDIASVPGISTSVAEEIRIVLDQWIEERKNLKASSE